ncbi:hypothetical protein QQF64_019974 [Cirrhinus molitorella]|uniref:Uncharacterized protein n=1 Tax=Cirrhinus molitorella TaxID=172907 RepID=A0ABR3LGZ4_9TELE
MWLSRSHNHHRPFTTHRHQISTLHPLVHSPQNSDYLHLLLLISSLYKEMTVLQALVWSRLCVLQTLSWNSYSASCYRQSARLLQHQPFIYSRDTLVHFS